MACTETHSTTVVTAPIVTGTGQEQATATPNSCSANFPTPWSECDGPAQNRMKKPACHGFPRFPDQMASGDPSRKPYVTDLTIVVFAYTRNPMYDVMYMM